MRQTNLAHFGRRVQLRFPAVTHPHFRFAIAHKGLDHIVSTAGHDQVIHALLADKHPLPPIVAVYARMGFVTTDNFTLANLLPNLFRFVEHGLTRTLDNRHRAPSAQRQVEEFAAQLYQSFKTNMVFVMQGRYNRFQTWTKVTSCLQAFWKFSALHFAAARTDDLILLGFNHHWFDLGQLGNLATDNLCWNLIQQVDVTRLTIVHQRMDHFVRLLN